MKKRVRRPQPVAIHPIMNLDSWTKAGTLGLVPPRAGDVKRGKLDKSLRQKVIDISLLFEEMTILLLAAENAGSVHRAKHRGKEGCLAPDCPIANLNKMLIRKVKRLDKEIGQKLALFDRELYKKLSLPRHLPVYVCKNFVVVTNDDEDADERGFSYQFMYEVG